MFTLFVSTCLIFVYFAFSFQARSKGQTLEGANDPLTAGDLESHKAIVHGFRYLFPWVAVVSEERDHGDKKNLPVDIEMSDIVNISDNLDDAEDELVSTNDVLVWVDPLDATQEYTENLTQYVTTMVCLVIKGIKLYDNMITELSDCSFNCLGPEICDLNISIG